MLKALAIVAYVQMVRNKTDLSKPPNIGADQSISPACGHPHSRGRRRRGFKKLGAQEVAIFLQQRIYFEYSYCMGKKII